MEFTALQSREAAKGGGGGKAGPTCNGQNSATRLEVGGGGGKRSASSVPSPHWNRSEPSGACVRLLGSKSHGPISTVAFYKHTHRLTTAVLLSQPGVRRAYSGGSPTHLVGEEGVCV